MKPKAVLFKLWHKHFPVIKAFAEANPDHLIVVPHSGFRELPLFASFSGRIIPFDVFGLEADQGALSRIALEKAAFLEQLPHRPSWAAFCEGSGVPARETAQALFQDAAPRLHEMIVQIECLERVYERLDIRLTVLNEENTLLPKSMVVWSKCKGIPVLHINHSLGMSGWYTVHGKILSEALAVYGPIVADGPMETGLTGDRIFISGNPDWLVYDNPDALKKPSRDEMLARYFPGPAAPLIVFGTTFSANLTATEEKKDTSASATAFFRAVAALRKAGKRLHCVVKLRPNNDKSFETEYTRLAEREGLVPGDYLFLRGDLEKLLLAADAIVSVDSTLSADALLADTLAINLVTEEGWRRGPYYPGYTGVLECRYEDLAVCLTEALENKDLQERLRTLRRRSRKAFQGAPREGSPTVFLAELIAGMARTQSRETASPGADPSSGKTEAAAAGATLQAMPRRESGSMERLFPAGRTVKMTLVLRPARNLFVLKQSLLRLVAAQSVDTEYLCMVAVGQAAEASLFLGGQARVVEADGGVLSRAWLSRLAEESASECFAVIDAEARLGSGWDIRLRRHLVANSAVGPLVNLTAGTQSLYHYLNAGRVDPDDVEALDREVSLRYPAMAMASDWLYDKALLFGKDVLSAVSRIPDREPETHFLGLGRKLRAVGSRLLVAKDVYCRLD
ncbi:MAG: hypothetical protein ABI036_13430 [Fibrobacteria bacterium]